jgi:hypothetical protein
VTAKYWSPNPGEMQIMYGVGGERCLAEVEPDLAGYEAQLPSALATKR